MKKVVAALIGALVLAGGGYFGWTTLRAAGTDALATPSRGEPRYVEMEPLTAPFVDNGRYAHYVVLQVDLEVGSERAVDKVQTYTPRLRDAFITELHALARLRPANQKVIDLARVKTRLDAAAEEVLGGGVGVDVLVQLAH